ncbi:MAG: beta-propeller fold lactonase family protein [Candidatus Binatia bacterium]
MAQASVYVANLGSGDVSVIDRSTNSTLATVPVGSGPDGIASTPDGRSVYVTNFGANTVSVIDTNINQVTATVPVGSGPVGIAITANGQFAYVTNRGDGTLSAIQTSTNTVTAIIPVGSGPDAVVITPDGARAYVTNSFSQAPGLVSVVDLQTNAVAASVAVARNPNRVAITPDGAVVYVTNFRSWNAAVIDTATNTVTNTIRVSGRPSGVTVDPNGTRAYVVTLAGRVQVVDTATNRIIDQSIIVGNQPYGIAIPRTGGLAYVANFTSDTISVVDLEAQQDVADIAVGSQPFAVAVSCVGHECTDAPYTPRPTNTPVPVPTATPITLLDPTATIPEPTVTPTASGDLVTVVAGSVTGQPGTQVQLPVSLRTSGEAVAGVQNDLTFSAAVRIAPDADGAPDCVTNPAIHKSATVFGFLPAGCQPGTDCDGIRAIVFAFNDLRPIADGSVLYTCTVDIAPDAAAGAYPLIVSNAEAGDPTGMPLAATGTDGDIVVDAPSAGWTSSILASMLGRLLCSAGARDGAACAVDADCPDGACVVAQGVCDGGKDDGLLCDCPGATCVAGATCGTDPTMGTCSGGTADGQCCDAQSNCAGNRSCVGTQKVCLAGPVRGMSCLRDAQCLGSQCGAIGKSCGGGDFAGFACVADGDCPRGACIVAALRSATPPATTPTPAAPGLNSGLTGATGQAQSGGGCEIARSGGARSSVLWALLPLAVARLRKRRAWASRASGPGLVSPR